MSLLCGCDFDYEFNAGEWYYTGVSIDIFFEPLATSRRKRCCSCNEIIDIGASCLKFERVRYPHNDVEARFNGFHDLEHALEDEAVIRMADHFHCEKCGEIYLNLTAIGYECLSPSENMPESLKEYHELSGFKANKRIEPTANSAAAHA